MSAVSRTIHARSRLPAFVLAFVYFLHVACRVLNAASASATSQNIENCLGRNEHVESHYVKQLCTSNPGLEEFMTAADTMIRSDCLLVDPCRRVVDRPHDDVEEVDFVVVGGGAAGPVVAGRLSENPNWTVTLLESGPEQPAATDIPALLSSGVGTKYDWQYTTTPQQHACLAYGGVCGWPRGKMLGGTVALSGNGDTCEAVSERGPETRSGIGRTFLETDETPAAATCGLSSITASDGGATTSADGRARVDNGPLWCLGSMYSRGHRATYDAWLKDGNVGWGYEDVLPFFKMAENNKDYGTGRGSQYHGTRGPVPVQKPADVLPIARTLVEAGKELGYQLIDMNDPEPVGFSIAQLMMTGAKTRVTMPTAYLRPHLRSRGNLRVYINSHATRLLVDAERKSVYGVEYVDAANATRRLLARKEVVLCAGVIGSAHLLMLSGIGPEEDLAPLGVPVVQNLRTGRNLQHHVATRLSFRLNVTNDRSLTYDSIVQYLRNRTGPMSTTGGLQTSAFLRSDQAGPKDPADVQLFFDGFSPNCANARPAYGCATSAAAVDQPAAATMNVRPANIMPRSRGTIKLTSADPFVRPSINPNYLSVEADARPLVWALKLALSLVRTDALRRLGATVDTGRVQFCERHEFATDAYWRCLVRYHTRGENHHAGTCKMGPASDPDAVVDPELRVHNVRGVRVADASVMPLQPNCNPIGPIVMVAERAAHFIKNAWK